MTPPAVRIKATVVAEGGDWGGGNPVALASSPYCRFTSARLAPSRRHSRRRRESSKKESCFQPVIVRLVPGGSRNLFSPANPF